MDKKVEDEQTTKNVDTETGSTDNEELNKNQHERDLYVSVQDYTGEEYDPKGATKINEIAQDNRKEIEEAVQTFFLEKYKTEVIVQNVVGTIDNALVYVESVGEPHFYSEAFVPIDDREKKVLTDEVWSNEGIVENTLITGIFAMIFDEEIAKLDEYMEKIVNEYPVTGIRQEALESVYGNGYSTPYYYTNAFHTDFQKIYDMYMENPHVTKEQLKKQFSKDDYDPEDFSITIYLFMEIQNVEPDKEIFDKISYDIENMQGIPQGIYSIYLHDLSVKSFHL
ncbi:DUF1672 family protein [Bacillus carboniphilus]|uniref:DUF1672 family protein n=1 Tax=Bacillus carboniphilus TaxID=86663 RepID=A0ABY9JTA7_9BACI|nr:DUF1672 family protein [Bacillus carboniphilus]WLR41523.1 DUF1672 family protein [Bacillus carboniphilus]